MNRNFIYPVGDGTKETFEKEWYIALGFGEKQDYGYHEGADINLKTGGDSDNGKPLRAISDWNIEYYHNTHSESGFGIHFVYKVKSPWGDRWIHKAHTQKPLDWTKNTLGNKGDKLAEIDKTGRPRLILPAHLHITVFKKDPFGLTNKIDHIFKTLTELNEWCEDPIDFFAKWYEHKEEEMDIKQIIETGYVVFTGQKPNSDEVAQRIKDWTTPQAFLESITGDSRFYSKYIQPQLNSQKIAQENACNKTLSEKEVIWQTELKNAKKGYEENLNKKVEKLDPLTLIRLGISNLFSKK